MCVCVCVGVMYSSRLALKDTAVSGKFNTTQANAAFADVFWQKVEPFSQGSDWLTNSEASIFKSAF